MQTLTLEDVRRIATRLSTIMEAERDHLLELDRAVGDGDLGLTMTRAFAAASEAAMLDEPLPGRLFIRMGMAMSKAAPSTMGTLMATGFMRGGKAVGDAPALGTAELAAFFRGFTDGIMERGKTKPGNKTVVDSLDPAAAALAGAAASGADLVSALADAVTAAEAGREAARAMVAQHGRAAMFREQTVGVDDGGAYVGALIVRGFHDALVGDRH